ncbi:MAG: hypothetical protein AAB649_01520 [Patescibacteria group bacterium]
MSNLITHALTFSKESQTEYFLKPIFLENDIRDIITIRTDIKNSEKLDFIDSLEKITKAYAQGTAFTASTGVTVTQKTLTVADMKAEVKQNGKAFLAWVKEAALKQGVNENNISGTIFEQIVMSIFAKGIARDFQRQAFFGGTTVESLTSGVPNGTLNPHYKNYKGFWTRIIDDFYDVVIPAAQRVTMSNGAVAQVATHSVTGTSGTATIVINTTTYLITYATSTTQTATNFVTSWAATLLARGIVVTSSTADIILTAKIPGVAFTTVAGVNVTGDLDTTLVATTANTAPAALATDEAMTAMASMVTAMPNELGEMIADCVFMCTRSWIENYKATLRSLGNELSSDMILNGRKVLSYDGIPIVVRRDWDNIIATDFPGQYPHRCLLTVPKNLVFGTDGAGDDTLVELVYDTVGQENIFRVEYKAGTQYIHSELIVAAF